MVGGVSTVSSDGDRDSGYVGGMATAKGEQANLGRLTHIDPRQVWAHEARDFTPWLLANADVLGQALGMDLALENAEHPVGGFSLDLIGVDEASGERVIVENQLEPSDHTHLGQILTYAGGTDPTNIVWVAPNFRDEHRAAIDWLNTRTDENTRFFAVEVSVVKIGDSVPAPLLELVAQPNDWGKTVKRPASISGKGEAYREFWAKWLDLVHAERPTWTNARQPLPQSWMTMSTGLNALQYNVLFNKQGPSCEIYFSSSDRDTNLTRFLSAKARQGDFEAALGGPAAFDELPDRKACRISVSIPGSISTREDWDQYLQWFLDTQTRLRQAVSAVGGITALVSE